MQQKLTLKCSAVTNTENMQQVTLVNSDPEKASELHMMITDPDQWDMYEPGGLYRVTVSNEGLN